MDKRTLLALVLTALVIVATPLLFPARRPPPPPADSTRTATAEPARDSAVSRAPAPTLVPARRSDTTSASVATIRAETTVVRTNRAQYDLVSPGGVPARVLLPEYRSRLPGATRQDPVDLLNAGDRLIHLRIVTGQDTIALDTVAFSATRQQREGAHVVQTLTSVSSAIPISLTYRFPVDSFSFSLEGRVGTAAPTSILLTLPDRIRSQEADVQEDTRHLAVGFRRALRDAQSVTFKDLDSAITRVDTGAFRWVAERNKYFVVGAIASGRDSAFDALLLRGGSHTGREATTAHVTTIQRLQGSEFAFRLYAGPQSWEHLRSTAVEFENVNPYGGWLHGVVQPFATIVMRLLLWMRRTLNVSYGWVLVIFGVLVRLLLWPLNQNAMRSSMKMQRIQPQLAELQKKYKNDPEKQRDAMLKLYQEHGMSPFTPVLGCLPMLLPMPILFALYFVFQNTIELRGVSFLWLPDLSLRDPYFITPLFMGVSMFALSWIGMRGMPPSPQGKMMSYVMPVMFTVLFWNFASGLNLYYAVQNIAALPQQLLLARERETKGQTAAKPPSAPRPKGTLREGS